MSHTNNIKAYDTDDGDQELNADSNEFIAIDTHQLDWVATPSKGVWRKRLELKHGEMTQLTSLVKFEPGSSFNQHGHPAGEELLILSGVFSDQTGDNTAGYYVRNPDGFHHAPWTKQGVTLLVQLCRFQESDKKQFSIDTNHQIWKKLKPGVSEITLHEHGKEKIHLIKMNAPSSFDINSLDSIIELFIIKGALAINTHQYNEGNWIRSPKEKLDSISCAGESAVFYLKTK